MRNTSITAILCSLLASACTAGEPALQFTEWVSDLPRVVDIVAAGDDSEQLYLVQQSGQVRVLDDRRLREQPLLDLTGRVSTGGEQGLLSIAVEPARTQRRVYAYYTDLAGNSVLSRFVIDSESATAAVEDEQILLQFEQPYSNHNGGKLLFGRDGYLYLSTGDGGSAGDPQGNGQRLDTLLGKILRIDVSGDAAGYAIPPDNPFVHRAGARPEIWAYGLRNPWRMSFDRKTGDLFIGDVGQNEREEIDLQPSAVGGLNFGWNCFEGRAEFRRGCSGEFVPPIAEYSHAQGCSVTGGYVYRGAELPSLQGLYLAGDFCTGRVFGLKRRRGGFDVIELADTDYAISTFGEDAAGNLYLSDYGAGRVYRIGAETP